MGLKIKNSNYKKEKREDGGEVGWGEYFLPHKFIKRTLGKANKGINVEKI